MSKQKIQGKRRKRLIELLDKTASVKKGKPGSYMKIMKEIYQILDGQYVVWDDIIIDTKETPIKILKEY